MQKLSGKLRIYYFSVMALSLVAAVLCCVALFTSYDGEKGYFDASLTVSLMKAVAVVATIFCFTPLFLLPKGELDGISPATIPTFIPSVYMALVSMAISVILFVSIGGIDIGVFTVFIRSFQSSVPALILFAFAGIMCLGSATYFILNFFAAGASRKQNEMQALAGYAVLFASCCLIALSYFDRSVSMNAPGKLFFNLSTILFMLFMLCELRTLLECPKPRLYLVSGALTMVFSAVSSLPWLIAFAFGKAKGPIYPTYLIYFLFTFGIFAYTAVRLGVFVSARSLAERMAENAPPEEDPADISDEDLGDEPSASDDSNDSGDDSGDDSESRNGL